MDSGRTATLLKSWAVEEGFDRAGVARLVPSEHAEPFRDWIGRGDHAGMGYMAGREAERLDPTRLLERASSVLCVALQYHPPQAGEVRSGGMLDHVARYARGRDYHDTMRRRLERLAERIHAELPEVRTRAYVDTGPVLERELAARAGIGSFGKNTNLLHPEAGSWFFLGEVLLTLELDPDEPAETPVAELCGSCSRCLEACPTGALPAPYRLDANRCISYWTIEHRGWLPVEARGMVADWLFGCDICQEVCPLNDAPGPTAPAEFAPDSGRSSLSLGELLELDRDAYVELFRGSPMKRAKLEGLQRNAAVVLGNIAGPGAVSALARALESPVPMVRGHAAWSLGELGGDRAEGLLSRALEHETDERARNEMESALARL